MDSLMLWKEHPNIPPGARRLSEESSENDNQGTSSISSCRTARQHYIHNVQLQQTPNVDSQRKLRNTSNMDEDEYQEIVSLKTQSHLTNIPIEFLNVNEDYFKTVPSPVEKIPPTENSQEASKLIGYLKRNLNFMRELWNSRMSDGKASTHNLDNGHDNGVFEPDSPTSTCECCISLESPYEIYTDSSQYYCQKNTGFNRFEEFQIPDNPLYAKTIGVNSKKNIFNLTLDTSFPNSPPILDETPFCHILLDSPVVRRLRELGFVYPEENEAKRRRLLYTAIGVLLIAVLVLVILNAIIPLLVHYYSQPVSKLGAPTIQISSHHPRIQYTNHGPKNGSISPSTKLFETTATSTKTLTKILANTTSLPEKTSSTSTVTSSPPTKTWVVSKPTTKPLTPVRTTTPVPSDWLPVPHSSPTNVTCKDGEFKCKNGVSRVPCLLAWERCDGIEDCSDGSDEQFCDKLKCYGNFQCNNGQCVSLASVCNGLQDCVDGSDENVCKTFKCQPYERQCSNGYCIPQSWVCDGDMDCPNHEDEVNCSSSCPSDEFLCKEGWCIPSTWRCNGIIDCRHGDDESMCDISCPPSYSKCHTSGECVPNTQWCDGVKHCADGSDEMSCVSLLKSRVLIGETSTSTHAICADGWTTDLSDLVCHQLGYMKSKEWSTVPAQGSSQLFVANTPSVFDSSLKLQSMLTLRDTLSCLTRSEVRVECSKFECGVWNSDETTKIRRRRMVGGHVSAGAQWPSVGILYHTGKKWACTISLITPNWAITSALCIKRTDPNVRAWRIFSGNGMPDLSLVGNQISVRRVDEFVFHPNYKFYSSLADFDVALIHVHSDDSPFQIESTVSLSSNRDSIEEAICPPSSPTVEGATCVTAGWGYTSPGGYSINQQLRHMQMNIVSVKKCNDSQNYNGHMSNTMMCAESNNQVWGPCFNDEGSPLMCLDSSSGKWYLSGILTAHSCGTKPRPALYSNVYSNHAWIIRVVGQSFAVANLT